MIARTANPGPLQNLDEWDDFVASRYRQGKSQDEFRNYSEESNPGVAEFYRQNHAHQTLDFVLAKRAQYLPPRRAKRSIWEAADYLNTLVDDSDPDTDLSQIEHLMQTAEAIRHDGHPRWFILAGFVHDLGKTLCLEGEPQWAVVGDTFPWAAPGRARLYIRNTSRPIRIVACRSIKLPAAFTRNAAVSTKYTCPGDTMSISIK